MNRPRTADTSGMGISRAIAVLACTTALALPAGAQAAHSVGSYEQVEWVRRAATNFVRAELAGNGAGACAILNAPLRATEHARTCEQRWNAKLSKLLREPGARARLRAQRRAIGSAIVIVHGNAASLELSTSLMGGPNRFVWTENCWMLDG